MLYTLMPPSCRPSFTQPPARKLQKLDTDKPKKPKTKLTSSTSLDAKVGEKVEELESALPKMKGETPDHFWASVEPYCADITDSDIQMLQEGIRSVSSSSSSDIMHPTV